MNKPFRIKKSDYNQIYFASDFHYNHQKDFLWKPRGFNSYQEHDQFIEEQCDTLTSDDLLIFLGDYSLNTTDEATLALLQRTKARMFYIFGNHEGFHSRFYRNAFQEFSKYFCHLGMIKSGMANDHASLNGLNFNSSTPFQIFPFSVNKYNITKSFAGLKEVKHSSCIADDIVYFGEEGYFQIGNEFFFCRHMAPLIWDKMKYENYFSICGHSHGNLPKASPFTTDQGKILDVGVDNAIKYNGTAFFKVDEVVEIMKTKKIVYYDHHGDDNI